MGSGNLVVFKGSGTPHQVVKHLHHGAAVKIWEEKEGWVRISEKDEEWVPKEHLQIETE